MLTMKLNKDGWLNFIVFFALLAVPLLVVSVSTEQLKLTNYRLYRFPDKKYGLIYFSVTGGILRIPLIEYVDDYSYFEDGKYWEVEVEEEDDEEK